LAAKEALGETQRDTKPTRRRAYWWNIEIQKEVEEKRNICSGYVVKI
jgi:hypothetical protein